jgi:hypothetical protein
MTVKALQAAQRKQQTIWLLAGGLPCPATVMEVGENQSAFLGPQRMIRCCNTDVFSSEYAALCAWWEWLMQLQQKMQAVRAECEQRLADLHLPYDPDWRKGYLDLP